MLRMMVLSLIGALFLSGCGGKTTDEKVDDANSAIARMDKTNKALIENGVVVTYGKQAYLDVSKMSDEALAKNLKLVASFISDGDIVMDAANEDNIYFAEKAAFSQYLINARSALATLKAEKSRRDALRS